MSIRVRFPPSPTGYLHVGGARTALYNWFLARRLGGALVLRIEDTDRERSTPEMTDAILRGLEWLGVDWDEGPFFQSEGIDRHREDVAFMVSKGRAYRDFSTPEEIEADRRFQAGGDEPQPWRVRAQALGTDEAESRAAAGEPHAIRFLVPDGTTRWTDMVHGDNEVANASITDFVILRSDGSPTYNHAVVSDDAQMRISHVIRGDDHLSNTPKQILIYEALERPVPEFGHVPMILGADGKRLSKRHGATAVGDYEAQGILPWAMVNFLALLGWSPGDDREVMELDEVIEAFSMDRVLKKSSVFDPEKLEWLNGRHIARTPASRLAPMVAERLRRLDPPIEIPSDEPKLSATIEVLRERARTLNEMAERARPFVQELAGYEEKAVKKAWKDPAASRGFLSAVHEALTDVEWNADALETALRALAERLEVGAGKIFQPLRVALTGSMVSPGIFDVLVLLGREPSLRRLDDAMAFLAERVDRAD